MTKGFIRGKKFHPITLYKHVHSRINKPDKFQGIKQNKTVKIRSESEVDPVYGLFIANGYEDLKHDPNNPEVKQAYDKFIEETLEQARELQKNGMRFDPVESLHHCVSHGLRCGKGGSYENANEMHKDIENNKHLIYRSSDNDYKDFEDHPMYRLSDIKNVYGKRMRVNDVFRAVHDINGHNKANHSPFTPEGEQRAYLQHKKMYSPEAIRALFTETQGQGNWVNFNRKTGEQNRHFQDIGDLTKLSFPPQKAGLFPDGIIFCR